MMQSSNPKYVVYSKKTQQLRTEIVKEKSDFIN